MSIKRSYKKRNFWSDKSEKLLLELWANRISQLRETRKNRNIMEDMAKEMHRCGMQFTATEIIVKMHNLNYKYRKELVKRVTGNSASFWPLFDDIHKILGDQSMSQTTMETEHIGKPEYESVIKCGEVQFIKNDWMLQLVCARCGKEMAELQEFVLHSLQHHFDITENEINLLISQITGGKKDKNNTDHGFENESCIVKEEYEVMESSIIEENVYAEKNELSTKRIWELNSTDETSLSSKDLPTLKHVDEAELVKNKNDNQNNFEFLDTAGPENTVIKFEADEDNYNLTNQHQFDPTECEIQDSVNYIDGFICKQCRKAFENVNDFTKHLEQHTGADLYDCPKCDKSYVLIEQLKEHLILHAKNPKKKLKLNKYQDHNNKTANQTEGEHNQEDFKITSTEIKIEQNDVHLEEFYVQNVSTTSEPTVENETIVMERIQETQQSDYQESAACNTLPHDDEKTSEVLQNTKTFDTACRKEKTLIQSACYDTTEVEEATKCTICNRHFKYPKSAERHMQKHDSNGLEHKCDTCGKIFYTLYSFRVHKGRHAKAALSTCEICGATFLDSGNLNTHRKRHFGIKKHKCTFCDKSFVSSTELKIHIRSHTGERPYACQKCNRTFKTASHYCNHRRRHTNERPCVCETCGKRFFDKKSLRSHQVSHTGETPFSCKECSMSFGQLRTLKEHMKLHSGVKGHECKICGEAFSQFAGLYSHMKRHKKS